MASLIILRMGRKHSWSPCRPPLAEFFGRLETLGIFIQSIVPLTLLACTEHTCTTEEVRRTLSSSKWAAGLTSVASKGAGHGLGPVFRRRGGKFDRSLAGWPWNRATHSMSMPTDSAIAWSPIFKRSLLLIWYARSVGTAKMFCNSRSLRPKRSPRVAWSRRST